MHPKSLYSAATLVCLVLSLLTPPSAAANPSLRKQVDQRGDFLLVGNTLAFECGEVIGAASVPAPLVGNVVNCPDYNLVGPDIYVRSDDPSDGMARIDPAIAAGDARSTAVLTLPQDAKVTYARLYWGSYANSSMPNRNARIERPSTGLNSQLMADQVWPVPEGGNTGRFWYQAAADVTEVVRDQGSGPYRVSDVFSVPLNSINDPYGYVAWYMVVFYERASEPQRNLALFEGLDLVEPGRNSTVTLEGFLVPSTGFDAKLGIIAFEGDASITGDGITFDGTSLSDAQNPVDNFFNSTHSLLGMPVSMKGDLPQLSGTARSMSGIDLDVLDLGTRVKAGQTRATLTANTSLDTYLLAAFVTSISTLKPNFTTSQKAAKASSMAGTVKPNEEVEYTIDIANSGSDDATGAVVTDPLPKGVTFVPGSLEVVSGPAAGKKTDAAGDDEAEYDAATRTVKIRIGSMASGSAGGALAINDKVQVRFKVKVDADTRGQVSNQATIRAAGKRGAAAEDTPTDADLTAPGSQSTDVTVNVCEVDMDCKPPTPLCDISSNPQSCVECITSADCKSPAAPDCSTKTHTCGCFAGPGMCQKDTDGDGISDDGETMVGTDPNDWDTDDDGTPDGSEFAPELDPDGDGVANGRDADSDNDALFDGTEQGFDCDNPATDKALGRCRPDADKGVAKSNPVRLDTDRGGVNDGSEDANLNGRVDAPESDPSFGKASDDKVRDADGDGLSDDIEKTLRTDPSDGDTDDDGVPDGAEANPSEDTDLDRLVNVLDVDSDDDALLDGTEWGKDCSAKGVALDRKHCRADADSGATKTSPLLRDTDRGGVRDGSEDGNLNGRLDPMETDPTTGHNADDGTVVDSDRDGLSDGLERAIGTNPQDADSDDDGAPDGEEPNPSDDHDGDGKINPLDSDSDEDAVFDGTELGKACTDPAIDRARMQCIADADNGATRTGLLTADTDFGGVKDGVEDVNKNGRIDPAELNPNDPQDDVIGKPCVRDADCGKMDSGLVCNMGKCDFGCRGMGGNTCPSPLFCSSLTDMVGMCSDMPPVMEPPDAGPPRENVPALAPGGRLGGAGCNCRVGAGSSQPTAAGAGLFAALALSWLWRRRRVTARAVDRA